MPAAGHFKFAESAALSPDTGLRNVRIDWDKSPNQLLAGDLSALYPHDASTIKSVAERPDVIARAQKIGVDPAVLVVAAIAQLQSSGSRSAARIAKAILGKQSPEELREILEMLGLV